MNRHFLLLLAILLMAIFVAIVVGCEAPPTKYVQDYDFSRFSGKTVTKIVAGDYPNGDTDDLTIYFEDGRTLTLHAGKYTLKVLPAKNQTIVIPPHRLHP